MYNVKCQVKDKNNLIKQLIFKTYQIFWVLKNFFCEQKIEKINNIFLNSLSKKITVSIQIL